MYNNRCPNYSFRCKYGACVDYNAKCDGKNDCIDGSDENMPECRVTSLKVVTITSQSSVSLCK